MSSQDERAIEAWCEAIGAHIDRRNRELRFRCEGKEWGGLVAEAVEAVGPHPTSDAAEMALLSECVELAAEALAEAADPAATSSKKRALFWEKRMELGHAAEEAERGT